VVAVYTSLAAKITAKGKVKAEAPETQNIRWHSLWHIVNINTKLEVLILNGPILVPTSEFCKTVSG